MPLFRNRGDMLAFLRTEIIRNGDMDTEIQYYSCDRCNEEISEAWPIFDHEGKNYCVDCAFKLGLIDEVKYCDCCGGISSHMFTAGINPETGEIEFTKRKTKGRGLIGRHKFSWEKADKDYRHTKKYQEWRKAVFERDSYTCQHCGQVGGDLNAHHIKAFKKFKKLRYVIENGLTLCEKCHKKVHRTK